MLQTSAKPLPPLQGTFPASGDGIFIAPAKLPLLWGLVHRDRVPAKLPLLGGIGPIGPIVVYIKTSKKKNECYKQVQSPFRPYRAPSPQAVTAYL